MKKLILRFLVLLPLFTGPKVWAQVSPYFPETGTQAVAQNVLSLQNPGVCLVIAAAPGLEDLPTIAYLRVAAGVRVAVVYISNGEDLPSDLNGETFYLLASRRKEEAYHALSYLGVESFFLNVPANEFPASGVSFTPSAEFAETFDSRLDSVISRTEPDIIMLDIGRISEEEGMAGIKYIKNRITEVMKAEEDSGRWMVKRLFVRNEFGERGLEIPVLQESRVWSKSYVTIAREAETFYKSLRFQIRLWHPSGPHGYVQVYPVFRNPARFPGKASSHGVEATLSALYLGVDKIGIGRKLRGVLPVIRSAARAAESSDEKGRLDSLHASIARVDEFIYRNAHSLNPRDLRVLTSWKLGLERLRCSILGVKIPYSVSDTVVAQIQLFFLKMGALDQAFDKGKTQLLFPGVVRKEWIVNEAQKEFYDWKDSSELRVISPQSIPLNSPETPGGFGALQVRTPFNFIVVHHGLNPDSDFTWRGSVPLTISPYRSVEILTPHVAFLRDTSIVLRFKSNVRDKSGGEFFINDPVVSSRRMKVEMPGKNYVITDTLPLVWKDTILTAPHKVDILASRGEPIGSFIVHPFDHSLEAGRKIGILSGIVDSPVKTAIARLGVSITYIDTSDFSPRILSGYSTIVADRYSAGMLPQSGDRLERLKQWIDAGGRLIVLPQYGVDLRFLYPGSKAGFEFSPITPAAGKIVVDSTTKISGTPNRMPSFDYGMKGFPVSFGRVVGFDPDKSEVVIASQSGLPLVVDVFEGHGRVIYCALNLYPGFLAIDDGAYSILTDMLGH